MLLAFDEEAHAPTLDDRHLLVRMVVLRSYEKRFETETTDHHAVAYKHLPLDAVGHLLNGNTGPIQMARAFITVGITVGVAVSVYITDADQLINTSRGDLEHVERAGARRVQLQTARAEFERLGAVRDLTAVEEVIRRGAARRAAPSTARKVFLFTDIVGSTTLAEAMGDEAWEHLLRWHDDALRALFGRHGGEVVNSTGDGFFVAFDAARDAVECAVAVQRALAEHRRTSGFAPRVRIGIHAAEATRRGEDYSGKGVHVAARIAALADAGQILASASTVEDAGSGFALSKPNAVTLKGVSDSIDVVSVSWD